jgi:hypothetical protein
MQELALVVPGGIPTGSGTVGGDPLTLSLVQVTDSWLPFRDASLWITMSGTAFTTVVVEGLLPGDNWVGAVGPDLSPLVVDVGAATQLLAIGADYQGLRVATTGGDLSSRILAGLNLPTVPPRQVDTPDGPTVVAVTPVAGAAGVSVDTASFSLSVTFDRAMDPATIFTGNSASIFLVPLDGAAYPDMEDLVSWSSDFKTVTSLVSTTLENSKRYAVHVSADGFELRDAQGNPLQEPYDQPTGFTTEA